MIPARGLAIFEAMNDMSDQRILSSAIPPEAAEERPPRKAAALLHDFLSSGWGVAMICAVVSLSVLSGIVYAGWQAGTTSPAFSDALTETDEPITTEEVETVDKYGFYEGGEVHIGVDGPSPDFPEGDHGYEEKTFWLEYYPIREKYVHGQNITDDAAPATRQLVSAGVFAEQTLYYQESYRRYYDDEQASYRLYADESGYYTYLFSVDGKFLEYDMPADGIAPFEDDAEAIRVALDFLRSVGVEITDEYTCMVMDPSGPYFFDTDPKEERASKVYVTRDIGGMIGEGYVVYCGVARDGPEAIYSRVINEDMYEAFGYITEEQVEHTRRRLYEAIGLLEHEWCDSYEIRSIRKERLIMSGNHLYLRVWITPVGVGSNHVGDIGGGVCYMRIDP